MQLRNDRHRSLKTKIRPALTSLIRAAIDLTKRLLRQPKMIQDGHYMRRKIVVFCTPFTSHLLEDIRKCTLKEWVFFVEYRIAEFKQENCTFH